VRKISDKFCGDGDCVWPMHVLMQKATFGPRFTSVVSVLKPTGILLQDLMCLYRTDDRKL